MALRSWVELQREEECMETRRSIRVVQTIAVGIFVVATYFSAWVGGLGVGWLANRLSLDLYSGRWFLWLSAVLFLVVTVLQLGQQICIFDRERRRIGLIARGRGPVVILNPEAE